MVCRRLPLPGGVAIVCSRGRRGARCAIDGCTNEHTKLCDFRLTGAKVGKTCDRRMCERHARDQGNGVDFCPTHDEMTKAATVTKCTACGFHIIDPRSAELCTDCYFDKLGDEDFDNATRAEAMAREELDHE